MTKKYRSFGTALKDFCPTPACPKNGDTAGGGCTLCRSWVCTPLNPYRKEIEAYIKEHCYRPIIHPLANEVGEQEDGWPSGDIVRMRCPVCETRWKTELPQ